MFSILILIKAGNDNEELRADTVKLIRARDQKIKMHSSKLYEKFTNNPDFMISSGYSKEKKAHYTEICCLQEQILNNVQNLGFCDPIQVFHLAMELSQFAHIAR